jgi:menaquinone-dependent protoporphyrinogen oxidase
MRRILVLFASAHGQTQKIAFRIAETLRARGEHVHLRDIAAERPDPSHYDAVVVGSPIRFGKHDARIRDWLKAYHVVLNGRPSAFFSVSMSASSGKPEVKRNLDATVRRFLQDAIWRPTRVVCFPGALAYTRYDWITRLMMRLISGSQGRPVDTSRDFEFTDWEAVDEFAAGLRRLLDEELPSPHRAA